MSAQRKENASNEKAKIVGLREMRQGMASGSPGPVKS